MCPKKWGVVVHKVVLPTSTLALIFGSLELFIWKLLDGELRSEKQRLILRRLSDEGKYG